MKNKKDDHIDLTKSCDTAVNALQVAIIKQAVSDWRELCNAEKRGAKERNGKSVKYGFHEIERFCKNSVVFEGLEINGAQLLEKLQTLRVKNAPKRRKSTCKK